MDTNVIILILAVIIAVAVLNFLWKIIKRAIASLIFVTVILLAILGITGNLNIDTHVNSAIETTTE